MSIYDLEPIDLSRVRTYPLSSRPSKVVVKDFSQPVAPEATLREFLDSLPRILAGNDLREIARRVCEARRAGKPVIAGLGGHVIKCGLTPILIDLIERNMITAIAMSGSGLIHDFEIALVGATSEDVDATLPEGSFGMAEETGRLINEALAEGAPEDLGIGEAVGRALQRWGPPFGHVSLVCAAYRNRVPVTVHLTIGADITHIHPHARGDILGRASHRDFLLFCSLVKEMDGGGVYLNMGSAVVLPEVFLKAVTVVRNLGTRLDNITTANLDFIQHYRPLTNVVRRPVVGGGRGFALTGHHEILIPLLAAAIRAQM
jgi:hypothetical protein